MEARSKWKLVDERFCRMDRTALPIFYKISAFNCEAIAFNKSFGMRIGTGIIFAASAIQRIQIFHSTHLSAYARDNYVTMIILIFYPPMMQARSMLNHSFKRFGNKFTINGQ